ncbi:cellulose binding domain-containing protein [Micromonospora sp. WMMD1102]|uniref:cellulose binding domain-containing protein n=1 Tax=Micromonospora sp. WMMD1102 TaxID=3016105 RepID=UPI0024153632|nr:cellulose binding domain-containing protein [Micromonospora sp. WMMD1102]MDG4786032.1 cellulose binding domain-containing protein [Micromonospora sp. WMMD1102]
MAPSRHRLPRIVLAGTVGLATVAAAGLLGTTAAQAAPGCGVDYTIPSSWNGGFTAAVTITNLGDRLTSWNLTWSFGAGQTVTQLWNGSVSQSGSQVTVTNASYNGTIATGGTVSFGFNGAWNGSNPRPASFTLNGTLCTGTVSPTSPPTSTPGTPTPTPGTPTPTPGGPTPPPVTSVGGSGPYPAGYETSSGLNNHTIYRPASFPARPLPVFVWGNGACSANGTSALPFLREIASHGFLVISSGRPNGSGSTTAALLTQAMNWAVAENSRQGSFYQGRIDTTKIAVAGFSCGGLEAYEVSNDARVSTTMIFSSGLLDDNNDFQLRRLTKPIAYVVGGPSDIAYPNAMDDWGKLPSGLPAFMGNLPVGHGGTYSQTNGGEFGRVAVLYLKWRLLGDRTAGQTFVGSDCGLCRNTQWTVQQKNLTL